MDEFVVTENVKDGLYKEHGTSRHLIVFKKEVIAKFETYGEFLVHMTFYEYKDSSGRFKTERKRLWKLLKGTELLEELKEYDQNNIKKNYCPDRKKDYINYINSKQRKEKRKQKLAESKGMCEKCGSNERLQVHHLNYDSIFNEKLSDLMTLCKKCHLKTHGLRK